MAHPVGFIGVVISLIGLYYGINENVFGWLGLVFGILLALISEKG